MSDSTEPRALRVVERWEDVPTFASEEEESEYWGSHRLSDALLAEFKPVPSEGDEMFPPAGPRPRREAR